MTEQVMSKETWERWIAAGEDGVVDETLAPPDSDSTRGVPPGQLRRRRFDHDEAVRRHRAGESFTQLGRVYGVTASAVLQAVRKATDPGWSDRQRRYSRDYQRRTLESACSKCGARIWKQAGARSAHQTGLCRYCLALTTAEGVRPDALLCKRCGAWKPDHLFPHQNRNFARRGRHSQCRPCQTKARQDYRDRHKQPCVRCGAPALPANEKGAGGFHEPRCRPCFLAAQRRFA